MRYFGGLLWLTLFFLCTSAAWAQQAPAEQPAEPPAEVEQQPQQGQGNTQQVPPALERLGRVEAVLLENDDPESTIEFAQEVIDEFEDDYRVRLLMGAAAMRLERLSDAVTHFQLAVQLAESASDHQHQLYALYNLGRALRLSGQLEEAAAAYDQYVTLARAHTEFSSFPDEAERIAATLRARHQAEQERAQRQNRRRRR